MSDDDITQDVTPANPAVCKCGRPRCTAADLERWRTEYPDGKPAADPPWAVAICWFNGKGNCGRKEVLGGGTTT